MRKKREPAPLRLKWLLSIPSKFGCVHIATLFLYVPFCMAGFYN